MYESPISVFRTQMETKIEGEILTAVHKVGVVVDKDELIKALTYDREQYQKGYQDATPKWISVEERLPPKGVNVLVIDKYGGVYTGNYAGGTWDLLLGSWNSYFEDITHWMPLPEPPQKDRGN